VFQARHVDKNRPEFTKAELDRWPVIIPPAFSKPSVRLAKACYRTHSFPHQNLMASHLGHSSSTLELLFANSPRPPGSAGFRHLCHFCVKLFTCFQREAPPLTGIRRACLKHGRQCVLFYLAKSPLIRLTPHPSLLQIATEK
jgi:hypothetical protein